jgi:two-component system, chemotaxis family, sensor kinase CheA
MTMFIEDEELRSLYETASNEHIEAIEAGLLQLEKNPTDRAPLQALLREAHSLKGDSRMLGVIAAEQVVHQMEDILMAIDRAELAVTPELCDRLYLGLDAVNKIAQEAIGGQPANLDLVAVATVIRGNYQPPEIPADPSPPEPENNYDPGDISGFLGELDFSALVGASNGLDKMDFGSYLATATTAATNNSDLDFSNVLAATTESFDNGDLDFSNALAATTESFDNGDLDFSNVLAATTESFDNGDLDFSNALAATTESFDKNAEDDTLDLPNFSLPAEESSAAGAMQDLSFLQTAATQPVNLDFAPPAPAEPAPAENFEISTIKVEASRLERLTIQADELSVAKLRISQSQEELIALYRRWEEWSRKLPSDDPQVQQFGQILNQIRLSAAEDTARLLAVANELESGIRQMRMLPLQSVFAVFPRMVRDLARQQNKGIDFTIEGGEILADKQILEALKDPLNHILRNAIDHGIEPIAERGAKPPMAKLRLRGIQRGNQIEIQVIDDGRGLDLDTIRMTALRRGLYTPAELAQMNEEQTKSLIFAPGFSTRTTITEISGRGVGLDVVRTNIEKIKGTVRIESLPGQGCNFRILLNNSLATVDALILRVDRLPYAMPIDNIETMQFIARSEIFTLDGKLAVNWQDQSVSLIWLADLLELNWQVPNTSAALEKLRSQIPCVFVKIDGQYLGILVDELLEQQQIVVKAPNKLVQNVRNISGASILGNGEICMVLNLLEIFQTASGQPAKTIAPILVTDRPANRILLVEDSIPIRTQVQRILVGAGYEVTTAVDGADGLGQLMAGSFDAVVSDIEMPNLSGLEMTGEIRQRPEYRNLPIVLVSTLAGPEHRQRGISIGASAYLSKGDFDQSLLLQTLSQLIK